MSGTDWSNDDIREFAAEFLKHEREDVPLSYLDERPLPAGVELDKHTGFVVRSEIPERGVRVAEYLDAGGFARAVWVRPLSWDTIDYHLKEYMWEDEVITPFGSGPAGPVYQGATFPANDFLFWDEVRKWYHLTPEAAVKENSPWFNIHEWERAYESSLKSGRWSFDGGPLKILHITFAIAEILRLEEEAEKLARREAIAAEEEAKRQAEREHHEKMTAAFEDGRELVSYRTAVLALARSDGKGTFEEAGYRIVLSAGGETGFGVWKNGSTWNLTHLKTGGRIPDMGISSRDDALALAGMLYNIWDGWVEMTNITRMPADKKEAAAEALRWYKGWAG